MGLWNGIKAIGKFLSDAAAKRQETIMKYKEQYDRYDDDRLIRKYRSSTSGESKIACGMLLRERGYNLSELENN